MRPVVVICFQAKNVLFIQLRSTNHNGLFKDNAMTVNKTDVTFKRKIVMRKWKVSHHGSTLHQHCFFYNVQWIHQWINQHMVTNGDNWQWSRAPLNSKCNRPCGVCQVPKSIQLIHQLYKKGTAPTFILIQIQHLYLNAALHEAGDTSIVMSSSCVAFCQKQSFKVQSIFCKTYTLLLQIRGSFLKNWKDPWWHKWEAAGKRHFTVNHINCLPSNCKHGQFIVLQFDIPNRLCGYQHFRFYSAIWQ